MNGEPEVMSNKESLDIGTWGAIAIVIVIIALGAWLWIGQRLEEPAAPTGPQGIQGIVTAVDRKNSSFTLEQRRLIESKEGPSFETTIYTIIWNNETNFFGYASPADVERDIVRTAESIALLPDKVVIITPREKAGNVLTAVEVRILPGSARAKVVE